jgi:hypothetical protein
MGRGFTGYLTFVGHPFFLTVGDDLLCGEFSFASHAAPSFTILK